jgi:hypothetical protein
VRPIQRWWSGEAYLLVVRAQSFAFRKVLGPIYFGMLATPHLALINKTLSPAQATLFLVI